MFYYNNKALEAVLYIVNHDYSWRAADAKKAAWDIHKPQVPPNNIMCAMHLHLQL